MFRLDDKYWNENGEYTLLEKYDERIVIVYIDFIIQLYFM